MHQRSNRSVAADNHAPVLQLIALRYVTLCHDDIIAPCNIGCAGVWYHFAISTNELD